ncbi:MAG TPA: DNA polymerase I [bacterium]|nr:DNA polymerase I [bacterium]
MANIYIIDGSSIVYRAFHAIRDLKTSSGQPTNAIYGFITALLKLLREKEPVYIMFVFDMKGPTVRHGTFAEYKANRKPMPDELSLQIPTIKKIIELFGIRIFEKQGYEADDIIASAVRKFATESNIIYIVTGDKDMYQLIGNNVFLINPGDGSITDRKRFIKKYGVEPVNIIDLIGLSGDKSDNIPGINGIGEKTALKLIKEYGDIEGIFSGIDKIVPEKLRKKLYEGKDTVYMGKKLGTLIDDIPIDSCVEDIKIGETDIKGLLELLENLEFRKLAAKIRGTFLKEGGNLLPENTMGFSTGDVFTYEEIIRNPEAFKDICESPIIEKCGFDIKRKMVELGRIGINFSMPFFDIAVAAHLTGKSISEKNIFSCRDRYAEYLESMGLKKLFDDVEIPLVKSLALLEANGIKTDKEFLVNFSGRLKKELDILQDRIYAAAGEVFNLNSSQQLSHILFKKLGLPSGRKTKTGFSTDNAVLKELSDVHPIVNMLLQYREIYKLNSTYAEGLIPFISQETGRIHPDYSQVSTSTGRLSCSNPNLQNIPVKTERGSEIRRAFCAEGKNILYSFDYSQIELRILAHFSQDRYLTDAFKNDRDIHQETADILFAGDSLFSPSIDAGGARDMRRVAKTINFGIIYGMGAYGLSQELNIALSEADNFIREYFARFSGVKEYINDTVKFVEKNGYVTTILKRRRYINEVLSQDKRQKEFGMRAAINMPIQGSAADLIKLAMNRINEYFSSEKMKSMMVLQVHDELLFETVPGEEKSVCKNVKDIMEGVMSLKVPLKVDVKKGSNYLDMENIDFDI